MIPVVIVGYGVMGQRRHKIIMENFSKVAKVTNIFEPDETVWDKKIDKGVRFSKDFRELTTRFSSPMAFFLCTPTDVHHVDFHRALDACISGVSPNFYIEKPLAYDMETAEQILSCIPEDSIVKIGENFVHIPVIEQAIKYIRSKKQKPKSVSLKIGHEGGHWLETWRKDSDRGTFLDNGVHAIIFLNHIFNEAPLITTALGVRTRKNIACEDIATAVFAYKDCVANIQASWVDQNGYLYGDIAWGDENLIIDARGFDHHLFVVKGGKKEELILPDVSTPQHSHIEDMRNFFNMVNDGVAVKPHNRYYLDMQMIEDVYISMHGEDNGIDLIGQTAEEQEAINAEEEPED